MQSDSNVARVNMDAYTLRVDNIDLAFRANLYF